MGFCRVCRADPVIEGHDMHGWSKGGEQGVQGSRGGGAWSGTEGQGVLSIDAVVEGHNVQDRSGTGGELHLL